MTKRVGELKNVLGLKNSRPNNSRQKEYTYNGITPHFDLVSKLGNTHK